MRTKSIGSFGRVENFVRNVFFDCVKCNRNGCELCPLRRIFIWQEEMLILTKLGIHKILWNRYEKRVIMLEIFLEEDFFKRKSKNLKLYFLFLLYITLYYLLYINYILISQFFYLYQSKIKLEMQIEIS